MWGTGRRIEKGKASFLPDRPQLSYFMIAVNRGIIKDYKGILPHTEREIIRKADNFVCRDTPGSGETLITVLAVNHSEDVEPCASLGRDAYLLSGQLPTAGNISPVQRWLSSAQ